VSERTGSSRWPLLLLVLAASATALFLGAALAASGDRDADTALLVAAMACFFATLVGGAWWGASGRLRAADAAAERASTAERIVEELRGPLLSLNGLSSSGVRAADELDEQDRRAFFELIDDEATRLRRTAEQLAAAMGIEAGRLTYDRREEDLGALVEEVTSDLAAGEHPVTTEAQAGLIVRVDRRRLKEALENVLDNAARFSPPDAPIAVRAYREDGATAVVEIADHGPGIPPGRRLEVLRMFSTWRPPGYEETPGAGLSLYIARAHVLAHGGQLTFEDPGDDDPEEADTAERTDLATPAGTVVRITLPVSGA